MEQCDIEHWTQQQTQNTHGSVAVWRDVTLNSRLNNEPTYGTVEQCDIERWIQQQNQATSGCLWPSWLTLWRTVFWFYFNWEPFAMICTPCHKTNDSHFACLWMRFKPFPHFTLDRLAENVLRCWGVSKLVNWCFEPSQPLGIITGLKETHK